MDEPKSKSQKKREADALQKIGVKLIDLDISILETLQLPSHLLDAIVHAKSIKSHGAFRRQTQLIGKLMRVEGIDESLHRYEALLEERSAQSKTFHDVEYWRSRLINEGREALTELMNAFSPPDPQHLRQLIKKAVDEQEKDQHTGASKALFRYLRSFIQ